MRPLRILFAPGTVKRLSQSVPTTRLLSDQRLA